MGADLAGFFEDDDAEVVVTGGGGELFEADGGGESCWACWGWVSSFHLSPHVCSLPVAVARALAVLRCAGQAGRWEGM